MQQTALSNNDLDNLFGVKQVLHVGCGEANPAKLDQRYHGLGWKEIRLDIDPQVKPDIIGDIRDMVAVESESMDAVWSSHNIEHLYAHEVPQALKEFHRVLKPGGELLITLPDIQSVAEYVAKGYLEEVLYMSPAGPITPLDVMYGYGVSIKQGNVFMAHKTAFTAQTLGKKIVEAGFTNVQIRRDNYFNLWGFGNK